MKVSQNVVNRKATLKAQILKNITETIENYKPDFHIELRLAMLQEITMLKTDQNETDIPITEAIMRNTGKTKLQAYAFMVDLTSEIRRQLANAIDKQFEETKKQLTDIISSKKV